MITRVRRTTAPRALAATGVLASGALMLAGCSSSSSPGAATPSGNASGSAAIAQYTACLKSHGVTLPSGGSSGRPSGRPTGGFTGRPSGAPNGGFGGGASANPSEAAAMQACASLRPTGQGGFGGRGSNGASGNTQAAAFISCMKDNGVTVTTQQVRSITTSTDQKTIAALKVCKPLLPTGSTNTAPTATPTS
ncbi:hypothetical protein ABUW04_04025 [Streptacidiphilus sp. N1-10]|uniref:PT repeat-containing protein n=1 Tax=Streptacidiphilus jeojiensis TaxID=3229225 RepID=A0ABV6XGM8_9ACTN